MFKLFYFSAIIGTAIASASLCDQDCNTLKCPVFTCADGVTVYGCTGQCFENTADGTGTCFTPQSVCPLSEGDVCYRFIENDLSQNLDRKEHCPAGLECRKRDPNAIGFNSIMHCLPILTPECAPGEEFDALINTCVAVSCDAESACAKDEVCVAEDFVCVRQPCPRFTCEPVVDECVSGSVKFEECNECTCTDSRWGCTEKACNKDDGDCYFRGQLVQNGDHYKNVEEPCFGGVCDNGRFIEIAIDCAEQFGLECPAGQAYQAVEGECCRRCVDFCEGHACAADQVCVAEPKQCLVAPCPQYRCEKKNPLQVFDECDRSADCPHGTFCKRQGGEVVGECTYNCRSRERWPKEKEAWCCEHMGFGAQCTPKGCRKDECVADDGQCFTVSDEYCTSGCFFRDPTDKSKCLKPDPVGCASDECVADDGQCFTVSDEYCTSGCYFRDPEEPTKCSKKDPCKNNCPKLHRPVCGSDGVKYGNMCLLRSAAACSDVDIKVACPAIHADGHGLVPASTKACDGSRCVYPATNGLRFDHTQMPAPLEVLSPVWKRANCLHACAHNNECNAFEYTWLKCALYSVDLEHVVVKKSSDRAIGFVVDMQS